MFLLQVKLVHGTSTGNDLGIITVEEILLPCHSLMIKTNKQTVVVTLNSVSSTNSSSDHTILSSLVVQSENKHWDVLKSRKKRTQPEINLVVTHKSEVM